MERCPDPEVNVVLNRNSTTRDTVSIREVRENIKTL